MSDYARLPEVAPFAELIGEWGSEEEEREAERRMREAGRGSAVGKREYRGGSGGSGGGQGG
eukprot:746848-Hanusia_phi.AAC.3